MTDPAEEAIKAAAREIVEDYFINRDIVGIIRRHLGPHIPDREFCQKHGYSWWPGCCEEKPKPLPLGHEFVSPSLLAYKNVCSVWLPLVSAETGDIVCERYARCHQPKEAH